MQLKLNGNCSNLMTLHAVSESRTLVDNCKMTNRPGEAHFSVNATTVTDYRLSGHIKPFPFPFPFPFPGPKDVRRVPEGGSGGVAAVGRRRRRRKVASQRVVARRRRPRRRQRRRRRRRQRRHPLLQHFTAGCGFFC